MGRPAADACSPGAGGGIEIREQCVRLERRRRVTLRLDQAPQVTAARHAERQEDHPEVAGVATGTDRQRQGLGTAFEHGREGRREAEHRRGWGGEHPVPALPQVRLQVAEAQKATSWPTAKAASATARTRVSPPQVPITGENAGTRSLIGPPRLGTELRGPVPGPS